MAIIMVNRTLGLSASCVQHGFSVKVAMDPLPLLTGNRVNLGIAFASLTETTVFCKRNSRKGAVLRYCPCSAAICCVGYLFVFCFLYGIVSFDPIHNGAWFCRFPTSQHQNLTSNAILFLMLASCHCACCKHVGDILSISIVISEK